MQPSQPYSNTVATAPGASISQQADYEKIWRHLETLPWCTLVGIGRAGADAFHSQLDSHPQILTFVGVLFFYEFWAGAATTQAVVKSDKEFWTGSASAGYSPPLSAADIVEEFVGYFITKFRTAYDYQERKDALGEDMNQSIAIDIPEFKKHVVGMLKGREVSSRNFLMAVYAAYAMALEQDVLSKRVAFHHIHHVRKLPPYLVDFPHSKIIATNRDPRAAYVSGVEHRRAFRPSVNTPGLARAEIERLMDHTLPLFSYGDRFRVIRMEDLSDETVMREVCEWLGVVPHPCVMTSTWNGLRWWGDRFSQARIQHGLDEKTFVKNIRTNRWEAKMAKIEKYVLEFIIAPRLDQCGYARVRRRFWLHAIGTFFAILIPMTYERPFFSPAYLARCLLQFRIKDFLRVPYHYAWRVSYYYKLYFRTIRGGWLDLPCFGRHRLGLDNAR